ncbi:MAG: hypothetical protein Q7T11_05655 [Deltaproteobacteria bacterium]|nr:hypothetical protein [Deltaproteobacteria bacterium]
MRQKNDTFVLLLLILVSCAGASGVGGSGTGSGESGDGAGDSGTGSDSGTTEDSLFQSGPVDIPITISKAEAIDPKLVTVTIDGADLVLTGAAGAVVNTSDNPQVWARNEALDEIITVTTSSNGSFPEIRFTHASSSFSSSVAIAGYNGTTIGIPIFLKIDNNTYSWLLTNGSTVVQGALAMSGDVAYVVSASTTESAAISGLKKATTTTSTLYSLTIAGTSETIASGDISIDQVYAITELILVRSGNKFYYPNSESGFTLCCEVPSDETIVATATGATDALYVGVGTNEAFYLCSRASGDCVQADTLATGESYHSIIFDTSPTSNETVALVFHSTSSIMLTGTYYGLEGTALDGGTFGGLLPDNFVSSSSQDYDNAWGGESGHLQIYRSVYKEGNSGTSFQLNAPTSAFTTGSGTAGSDTIPVLIARSSFDSTFDDDDDIRYALNGSFVFDTLSGTKTLLSATNSRTIFDAVAHPNTYFLFFCGEDGDGNGQIYAYCPRLVNLSQTGSATPEIIQLTSGDETCNENKNWKLDTDSTNFSIVIMDTSDADAPQIRFIDPDTQPELADCFP